MSAEPGGSRAAHVVERKPGPYRVLKAKKIF